MILTMITWIMIMIDNKSNIGVVVKKVWCQLVTYTYYEYEAIMALYIALI